MNVAGWMGSVPPIQHGNVALPWAVCASVTFTIAGILMLLFLKMCIDTYLRRWRLGHIPLAPGGMPFIGHLIGMATHPLPWELMLSWNDALQKDIIRWCLPFEDWIVVRGGECMKAVLQTKFKDFHKEMAMSFHPFLCILGTGLVTSHGELWQQQRKMMTPAFKGDILQNVVSTSVEAVKRLMSKLDPLSESGGVIEIEEEFRLLTLQVITEAIMSLPYEESDRVFPKLYLPIMEECHRRVLARWREYLPIFPSFWQHRSRINQLDWYVGDRIKQRWEQLERQHGSAQHGDLLDLILAGKMRAGEKWSRATQTQLCYEIKTFLLAGHETSAAMLTCSLLELARDADLRERVIEEADAVFGTDGLRVPTRQEVEGMTFTMACLQETLRKYSVVPVVTRIAQADTEICGLSVPKGAKVVIHMQGTHLKWRDPEEYRPQRFLPGGEFEQFPDDIKRFMFVPFGQGPRVCIGQHFSLMESRVVLAALVQRYHFNLQRPYELDWIPRIIPLQPQGGVPVTVSRR